MGWAASTTSIRFEGARAVAITSDDQAGERFILGPMGVDGAGHRGGGFAGAHHDRAPRGRRRKVRRDSFVGGGRRYRGLEQIPGATALSHELGFSPPLRLERPQADAFPWPISWRASPSSTRAMPEWSQAAPPAATAALNSSWQAAVFGRLTASARSLQSEVKIFLVQLDTEPRLERALDHPFTVHLKNT